MRIFANVLAYLCIGALAGCANSPQKSFPPPNDYVPISQIQVKSRFETVEVTRNSINFELKKCVPQFTSQSLSERLKEFPSSDILAFGQASSANIFLLRKTTSVCLHSSSNKFIILAAEAFFETVNPKGVPIDITDAWYKKIAQLIATNGSAKIAYIFNNGNTFIVKYWVEPSLPFGLNYSSVQKKNGEWIAEELDAQFSHPSMDSIAVTKRSGLSKKIDILSHERRETPI